MEAHLDEAAIIEKIRSIKETLGEKLIILTHHYQRKEIVDLGDFRGDSFGLSQKAAADQAARYIVFCGVHLSKLLWSLENIGKVNVVTVPAEIKKDARLALDRMLAL